MNESEQKVGFVDQKWVIDVYRVQPLPDRLAYSWHRERASIDHPASLAVFLPSTLLCLATPSLTLCSV